MGSGELLAIFISDQPTQALREVPAVEAVVGRGLNGDRYWARIGTFSKTGDVDREVTLIEIEALEALKRDYDIAVEPVQARRNLLTRAVALNHLVGKEFRVGAVVLRGLRLCEPCGHLERLTVAGIHKALKHRGGLRAAIVRGGIVRKGDAISPVA